MGIEILKKNIAGRVDAHVNQLWIRKSMGTVIDFYILNKERNPTVTALLEEAMRTERNSHNHLYSWDSLTANKENIPNSAIERNKLWANAIAEEVIKNPHDNRPILTVVGMGHLAGFRHNFSFLSFLFKTLA